MPTGFLQLVCPMAPANAGPRTHVHVWVLGGAGPDHTVGVQELSCIISSSST